MSRRRYHGGSEVNRIKSEEDLRSGRAQGNPQHSYWADPSYWASNVENQFDLQSRTTDDDLGRIPAGQEYRVVEAIRRREASIHASEKTSGGRLKSLKKSWAERNYISAAFAALRYLNAELIDTFVHGGKPPKKDYSANDERFLRYLKDDD